MFTAISDANRYYLGAGVGFALGAFVVYILIHRPYRSQINRERYEQSEIHRIVGGYQVPPAPKLGDADAAFAQARSAYSPVYPGNTGWSDTPNPNWLSYLAEYGVHGYWGRRERGNRRVFLGGERWLFGDRVTIHLLTVVIWATRLYDRSIASARAVGGILVELGRYEYWLWRHGPNQIRLGLIEFWNLFWRGVPTVRPKRQYRRAPNP